MTEKVKKPFYKKWWFWVIIVIVLYSVGTSGEDTKKTEEVSKPQTTTQEAPKEEVKKEEPAKKEGISKAEFEQIQTGMSYDEVKAIIGTDGELQSESEIGGYKTQLYMWKGESGIGANANVTFQNNEVHSKAQYGLK